MMIVEGMQLLAEMQGETALAWQSFADANGVSVGALLNELAPILSEREPQDVDVAGALRRAATAAASYVA